MSINQYYATQRFEDNGTPVTLDRNETHNVLDNKIVLDTVPDEFVKVKVTSINGVATNEMVEIPYYEDITDINEFKVDYKASGFIYFHQSREAQTIGVSYKGKGYVCVMPNRIATVVSEDGKTILQTLDQKIEEFQTQGNYAKTEGDYAKQQGDLAKIATTNADNMTTKINNETLMIYKNSVTNYADIATTYPVPQNGWTVVVTSTNTRYRYNSTLHQWINIDVAPYDKIGDLSGLNTQNKTDLVGAINENVSQLNEKTSQINTNTLNISSLQTQIINSASGSPKAVFATISDLQSNVNANTVDGKKSIYVVAADGGWYYWNGTAWAKGGTYQSTGIGKNSVDTYNTLFFNKPSMNLFDKSAFSKNLTFYIASKTTIYSANHGLSDFIPVTPNKIYYVNFGSFAYFFDNNKNYVSAVTIGTGDYIGTYVIPNNCYYIRVLMADFTQSKIDSAIINEGTATLTDYVPYKILPKEYIKDIDSIPVERKNFVKSDNLTENLYDKTKALANKVTVNGTVLDSADYYLSDYIPCVGMDNFIVSHAEHTLYTVYDINKTFISACDVDIVPCDNYNFKLPYNLSIKYIRFNVPIVYKDSFVIQKSNEIIEDTCSPNWIVPKTNSLLGKNISTFGDSITWYDNKNFVNTHIESGSYVKGYQYYLSKYGCNIANYGVSGAVAEGIYYQVCSANFTNCDIATLTCGANDWELMRSLGEIKPIGSTTFDITTYFGAIQASIEKISNSNPFTRIILITPIRSYMKKSMFTTEWIQKSSEYNGYLEQPSLYADALKQIAQLYGLQIIDLREKSGLNFLNYTSLLGDIDASTNGRHEHPTNKFYKRIGEIICSEIS